MENYRFAKHNISDTVLKYAADKGISASKLRNTKYGYNYENMLSILEKRALTDKATLEDLAVAEKMYHNIKKMSHAKRAKIDYKSLKSRAKNVYGRLYSAELVEDRAEDARKAKTIEHVVAMDSCRPEASRRAGKALGTVVFAAAGLLAAGAAAYLGIQTYKNSRKPAAVEAIKPAEAQAITPAPAPVLPAKIILEGPSPSDCYDSAVWSDGLFEAYKTQKESKPQQSTSTADAACPKPPAPVEAPKTLETAPIPPVDAPVKPAPKAEKPKAPKTAKPVEEKPYKPVLLPSEQRAQARQTQQTPSARLTPPAGGGNITLKAIVHGEGYADPETTGAAGTGKAIIDLGQVGFNAYTNGFATKQECDTYDLDGSGARFWASAHGYLPVAPKLSLYGELGGGIENRDYNIQFDNGKEFSYGNKSPFGTLKLGLTEGKIHNEDFGVGVKHNYVLLQLTKHWGKTTGDAADRFGTDYDATRLSAKTRIMVANDVSLEGGIAHFNEQFSDFLEQNKLTGQIGVRWHAGNGKGYAELLGIYQEIDSQVSDGDKNKDKKYGPQIGAGWRIITAENVTMDATLDAGYLISQENDNEWFVLPGVTIYFGKKGR